MASDASGATAAGGVAVIVAMVTGVFAWLAARVNSRKDVVSGQAALLKAVQDGAIEQMAALRSEIAELRSDASEDRARIDALEERLADEKKARTLERHDLAKVAADEQAKAHLAEKRAVAAEQLAAEAAGERRLLQQRIDSLLRWLAGQGIDVPPPPPRSTEPILLGAPSS